LSRLGRAEAAGHLAKADDKRRICGADASPGQGAGSPA
jgi:hypothetical protein